MILVRFVEGHLNFIPRFGLHPKDEMLYGAAQASRKSWMGFSRLLAQRLPYHYRQAGRPHPDALRRLPEPNETHWHNRCMGFLSQQADACLERL